MKKFFAVAVLILCAACPVSAQASDETMVPVLQKVGSRYSHCYRMENAVYDEEKFKKLIADKDCSLPAERLKVDFKQHTLIGFDIGGDCFIRATAAVFRSENTKTYKVKIKNIWGGCRAGGSFEGWLVIEKIPSDYKVEFEVARVDGNDKYLEGEDEFSLLNTQPKQKTEPLETRAFEMKGCIQTIYNKQFVINDNEAYLKAIRNDASRERCLKDLEKIDFAKHTLLGIEINSGYCRTPGGLEYKAIKDETKKQYLLNISYLDPKGSVCRALSQYDLWLFVPKLPEDYEVKFEVKAREK